MPALPRAPGRGGGVRSFSLPRLAPESASLLHLDCLRLIAAAGIVFLHLKVKVDGGAMWQRVVAGTDSYFLLVNMFFAISGYVIAFVYMDAIVDAGSYAGFLRRRVARLGPLHWLTLAAALLFAAVANAKGIAIVRVR